MAYIIMADSSRMYGIKHDIFHYGGFIKNLQKQQNAGIFSCITNVLFALSTFQFLGKRRKILFKGKHEASEAEDINPAAFIRSCL